MQISEDFVTTIVSMEELVSYLEDERSSLYANVHLVFLAYAVRLTVSLFVN